MPIVRLRDANHNTFKEILSEVALAPVLKIGIDIYNFI